MKLAKNRFHKNVGRKPYPTLKRMGSGLEIIGLSAKKAMSSCSEIWPQLKWETVGSQCTWENTETYDYFNKTI